MLPLLLLHQHMDTKTKISSFNAGFRTFSEAAILGMSLTVTMQTIAGNVQCLDSK